MIARSGVIGRWDAVDSMRRQSALAIVIFPKRKIGLLVFTHERKRGTGLVATHSEQEKDNKGDDEDQSEWNSNGKAEICWLWKLLAALVLCILATDHSFALRLESW